MNGFTVIAMVLAITVMLAGCVYLIAEAAYNRGWDDCTALWRECYEAADVIDAIAVDADAVDPSSYRWN